MWSSLWRRHGGHDMQVQLAQQIVDRNNSGMRVHRAPQLED